MGSGIINAKISKGAGGCSEAEVGELLTHDALPTLLADLPVDEPEDAVVHVQRPLPAHHAAPPLPFTHRQAELAAHASLLQLQLGRELF